MIMCRLNEIMKIKGISQLQISEDTGIARSTLSRLANNKNKKIDLETVNELCFYLNIDLSDMFLYIPISYKIEIGKVDFMGVYEPMGEPNTKEWIGKVFFTIYISYKPNIKISLKCLTTLELTHENNNRLELSISAFLYNGEEEEYSKFQYIKNTLPFEVMLQLSEEISENLLNDILNMDKEHTEYDEVRNYFDIIESIKEKEPNITFTKKVHGTLDDIDYSPRFDF